MAGFVFFIPFSLWPFFLFILLEGIQAQSRNCSIYFGEQGRVKLGRGLVPPMPVRFAPQTDLLDEQPVVFRSARRLCVSDRFDRAIATDGSGQ